MSPSTHIPVLSIPAGMYHSPAQTEQHNRRCKQYFLLFYMAPRGCTPHANGTAKGNSWWHRSQSFLHLGLSPAFTKQVWDLCWIWHCCAWPRLWLSKGMVLCRSPAALAVPEHLMQEGLWLDLAWFSYVWARKAGMPGLDCSMPFWDSSAWKIREAQFLLYHYEDVGLNCMKIKYWGGTKWGGMGQISWWEAGQCLADLGFRLGFVELGLSLDWALLGWVWALLVHGMRKGKGSWLEAGRRSGAVPAEQPGGDSIREVLMTQQQQQQQKRKGGKGRKGSCRAGCHGDPKEVWTSPALFTAAFEPRRELWLAIKGDMWPFAHRDRPLQLRVFSSFSPLSPPAIIHSDLRKKRKKKKSRTSCAPFALGTHPCRADRYLFQPIIPPYCNVPPPFPL